LIVSADMVLIACVLAPFAAAAAAPLLHRIFESWTGTLLALMPALIFSYLCGFIAPAASGQSVVAEATWIPSLGLRFSLLIDGLSLVFALLIAGIGALILIFSGRYLEGHPHQGRFLGFLMAFMGAMLGLVLTDNTVALYVFWELTTVTSFLLIGFDHAREPARRAAVQALIVTNVGGLALLVAMVALALSLGSWNLSVLRGLGDAVAASPAYPLVLTAVLVAAFTKSAQFPLHFWLPAAMQAPTPVSAYLHSATMVQAGVYLLARTNPLLGGTAAWTMTLTIFGSVTLLWAGVNALRQTDLKQMLAQTTVASLGLLVLLLGLGTEAAIAGAVVYFVAHALYKAALFLVGGVVETETGTRELTALGGLRDRMATSFIAAVLAAASMLGLPPALGFLAKEASYDLAPANLGTIALLATMIVGNALLGAVAIAVALRPFLGPLVSTPREPREGAFAMLLGPTLLAAAGIGLGWTSVWFTGALAWPAAVAVAGHPLALRAPAGIALGPGLLLSLITWVLAGILYWRLDGMRNALTRATHRIGWTFERGFDQALFGLVRFAAVVSRVWQHGRLELYLVVVFAMFAVALLLPVLIDASWPAALPAPDLTFYEWGAIALAALGALTVFLARTRLFAIIALGVQGLAVALLYMLFGAPDLSFTQFMVEILSVVIFALVMTRLRLDARDPRPFEDLIRDGGLATLCGLGVAIVLMRVLERPFDQRLSTFFAENSAPLAHGRNIVNVILVDFRGLDTLGEISVIMTAGIAVLALVHRRHAGRTKIGDGGATP
jgi:multicomponent Na+:H+ antiporter subunit A